MSENEQYLVEHQHREVVREKEAKIFYDLIERVALKSTSQWPLLTLASEGFCTFRVVPTWMVWLNLHKDQYPDIVSEEFYKTFAAMLATGSSA